MLRMYGLRNRQIGLLGLSASIALACGVFVLHQTTSQPVEMAHLVRTQCVVLEADSREGADGNRELWMRVSWQIKGTPYQLKTPVKWRAQHGEEPKQTPADYAVGEHISCKYEPTDPAHIFPDTPQPALAENTDYQWQYAICLIIALLSARLLFISYRRRERPMTTTRVTSSAKQLSAVAVLAFILLTKPLHVWVWGPVAGGCAAVWGWLIWREMQEEAALLREIKERMDDYEDWPEPPRDDSGLSISGDERIQGTWNTVHVRIHQNHESIRIEADIPNWPSTVFVGRLGSRASKPTPLGDPEFDRRMHIEPELGPIAPYVMNVLTPTARTAAMAAIDTLGAALEHGTLVAVLETDLEEIVIEQLEEIVEAARLLNRPPLKPMDRITAETCPALQLQLARHHDPMPRHIIEALLDNELTPGPVRQAAFTVLYPGQEASGRISIALDEGHVSTTDE